MPALLTTQSKRPWWSTTWSTAEATASALVTSSAIAVVADRPTAVSMSRAAAQARGPLMSASTTWPPRSASAAAIARPMPDAAPVTKATVPGPVLARDGLVMLVALHLGGRPRSGWAGWRAAGSGGR